MKLSSPAKTSQANYLREVRKYQKKTVEINGKEFIALKNVYETGPDTELMAESVDISPKQTFVEIGCGTGAVCLILGEKAKSGLGVDINPDAVKNAKLNKKRMKSKNVAFKLSNVFDSVESKFDIVICNPPYSPYKPKDEVDMMFWDENDAMKKKFFRQVGKHLKPGGFVYFGYADFADIDQDLPKRLAKKAGLKFVKRYSRYWGKEDRVFFVYKFQNPLK